MALRSSSQKHEPNLGEVLDDLENRLERLKRLYEQYFLGIQKIPPAQLHKEVERAIRELTQKQPRNTGLRYRLNTISQRFGSYNTYWNRVMRQIEQGTYIRDIARVKRRAYQRGEEIPDEVLAKMPALMRKRVLKDRERLARRHGGPRDTEAPEDGTSASERPPSPRVHHIDETDPLLGGDLETDMDELFSSIMAEDAPLGGDRPQPAAAAPPSAAPEIAAAEPSAGDLAEWREPGVARRRQPRAEPPAEAEGEWREPARSPPETPPAPPPRPRPAAARRPPAASAGSLPPGMDERQARALYDNYIRARQMVGAKSDVSFGKLMSSLRSQAPRIMERHRADGVEFNVVLKDNRVVVKATPKK